MESIRPAFKFLRRMFVEFPRPGRRTDGELPGGDVAVFRSQEGKEERMNKTQIVEKVAKNMSMSKAAAERTVNSFLTEVKKGVKKDKEVSIVGFGTFKVKSRKARMGRNPQTGKPLKIKASKSVGFKPGKDFKKSV